MIFFVFFKVSLYIFIHFYSYNGFCWTFTLNYSRTVHILFKYMSSCLSYSKLGSLRVRASIIEFANLGEIREEDITQIADFLP